LLYLKYQPIIESAIRNGTIKYTSINKSAIKMVRRQIKDCSSVQTATICYIKKCFGENKKQKTLQTKTIMQLKVSYYLAFISYHPIKLTDKSMLISSANQNLFYNTEQVHVKRTFWVIFCCKPLIKGRL
jgi:hypothetical protein